MSICESKWRKVVGVRKDEIGKRKWFEDMRRAVSG